jgi:hypothetical protein
MRKYLEHFDPTELTVKISYTIYIEELFLFQNPN